MEMKITQPILGLLVALTKKPKMKIWNESDIQVWILKLKNSKPFFHNLILVNPNYYQK